MASKMHLNWHKLTDVCYRLTQTACTWDQATDFQPIEISESFNQSINIENFFRPRSLFFTPTNDCFWSWKQHSPKCWNIHKLAPTFTKNRCVGPLFFTLYVCHQIPQGGLNSIITIKFRRLDPHPDTIFWGCFPSNEIFGKPTSASRSHVRGALHLCGQRHTLPGFLAHLPFWSNFLPVSCWGPYT